MYNTGGYGYLTTNFQEYAAGTNTLSDWTRAEGTTNTTLTKTPFRGIGESIVSGDGATATWTWNRAGTVTDFEILSIMYIGTSVAGGAFTTVAGRISGSPLSYYNPVLRDAGFGTGGTEAEFGRVLAGSYTALTSVSFTWSTATWYWVRMRMSGGAYSAKLWAYGSAEPAAYQISGTDGALTSGSVGIRPSNAPKYYGFFSVNKFATGGTVAQAPWG